MFLLFLSIKFVMFGKTGKITVEKFVCKKILYLFVSFRSNKELKTFWQNRVDSALIGRY